MIRYWCQFSILLKDQFVIFEGVLVPKVTEQYLCEKKLTEFFIEKEKANNS